MAANDIEMDTLTDGVDETTKFIEKSDSKQERIDEKKDENKEEEVVEVVTLRAGETEAQDNESLDSELELNDTARPLLDQTTVDSPNAEQLDKDEDQVSVSPEAERLLEQMEIIDPEVESPRGGSSISRKQAIRLGTTIFIATSLILIMSVAPHFFFTLEYDQYALARNKWTGTLDDKHVYEPGWYILLPWKEWIIFQKTVHTISLNKIDIYSTDQMKMKISFLVYYFLDKRHIGKLYRAHAMDYHQVVYKVCQSEIINHAQKFSIKQFRTIRPEIQQFISDELTDRLSRDYGVTLYRFFLNEIQFDKVINDINLQSILNNIYNEKAEYDKNTAIALTETERQVKEYKNLARIINVSARLNGTYGVTKLAEADYDRVIQLEHSENLSKNYKGLDITDDASKMSYCWMNSLVYNKKIKFYEPSQDQQTSKQPDSPYFDPISIMV